jgi:hypothetical protein
MRRAMIGLPAIRAVIAFALPVSAAKLPNTPRSRGRPSPTRMATRSGNVTSIRDLLS